MAPRVSVASMLAPMCMCLLSRRVRPARAPFICRRGMNVNKSLYGKLGMLYTLEMLEIHRKAFF